MGAKADLDILAIAAHPDDVEITCGGTLMKMSDMGRSTGVLDLTKGEMGTYGDENDRAREAAEAATRINLSFRANAGIPDSGVENNKANRLNIAQTIRDTRPELVILPHWNQRHPDHRICSQLGFDACFIAGLEKAELDGNPFRPRKIIYVSYFRNNDISFLVDISESFERKMKAIAAYESQFGNGFHTDDDQDTTNESDRVFQPGVSIYDLLEARNRTLGQMVGVMYAEAFTIKEQILVEDPQMMPVNSI